MVQPVKTIILGGYGNFGTRIAKRLAAHPHIDLVIAGRDLTQAQTLAKKLGHSVSAVELDMHKSNLSTCLRELNAGLVIHTAGPFQGQDYSIPFAVAEAGAHYIDLADGRQFACNFPDALDTAFRKAGKLAITGASTVPALSSAVVNKLSSDMEHIELIDICIAPAQAAPRGVATMKAVLGYCGEKIPVWSNGRWISAYGWSELTRIHFARMPSRLGALCDIPDLALFPSRYQGVQTVMFRAALEVGLTQRMFAALATLRRMKLLPRLDYFARFFHLAAQPFDCLGSKLGGMVVKVSGTNQSGVSISNEWQISADNNDGPEIPCMAAILLARKLANREIDTIGAYCCMDILTLEDFESEFRFWNFKTDIFQKNNYE